MLFGQGLVCTCAGHTIWDVPLSALGLDFGAILVGCSPLDWTLKSFEFHLVSDVSSATQLTSKDLLYQRTEQPPEDFCRLYICVCELQRRRETLVCVTFKALCSWCTCMSAGLAELCSDVSFLCFSGVFGLSFPCLSVQYYVAAVSISTNNSFILSTTETTD